MAANGVQQQNGSGDDFQVHKRNYEGFLTILKRSTIATLIVTVIVVFIIVS